MSKRPAIDLSALTSEAAIPMPEASQRAAQAAPVPLAVVPTVSHGVAPAPPPAHVPERPVSRSAPAAAPKASPVPARRKPPVTASEPEAGERTKTMDLQPLAFKVSPEFNDRFRDAAHNARLKLNELLFEALEAWEEKQDSIK